MAKQLYCFKIVLLQDYIPEGIMSKAQLQKITRFVDFCSFVFNSWQFNCSLAASAPSLDIKLFNDIRSFATVDSVVSNAAIKAFSRHAWYLIMVELIPCGILTLLQQKTNVGIAEVMR